MMATIREEIEADCSILLVRALLNKTLVAFGADGLGKHGTSEYPKYFKVNDIEVDIQLPEHGHPRGMLTVYLDDYDNADNSDIATDQNFMISMAKALQADSIDPACVQYACIELQGMTSVVFDIDVDLLLDWV